MIYKGFSGIMQIDRTGWASGGSSDADKPCFRFSSADISLNQGINTYAPTYGGRGLLRIVSPTTGEISGRVSMPLAESKAQFLFDTADNEKDKSFDISLYYRDNKYRKFTGCKVDSMTFTCKAGEIVEVNFDFVSKAYEEKTTGTLHYTVSEKLVTWDKVYIKDFYTETDDLKSSFSLVVKNNLVAQKTAKNDSKLLPSYINRGVQTIHGELSIFEARLPLRASDANEQNTIFLATPTFAIDDLTLDEWNVACHWSFRAPLSPEIVVSTLEWTKLDKLTATDTSSTSP